VLDRGEVDGRPVVLLDVREAGEREVVMIPRAQVWVPMARVRAGQGLEAGGEARRIPAGARVYVYCRTGGRSAEAVDLLRARGVDAVNVDGGVLAWVRDVDPHLPTY
jgi:adenylyltransferase/sulfurtransferase